MSETINILERLAKWRSVFAGWQLGTRLDTDSEANAVKDHRESTILLRAEVSALTALLLEKDIFSHAEFLEQLQLEAEYLNKEYEKRFPGFHATDVGMQMDLPEAAQTTKNWRP